MSRSIRVGKLSTMNTSPDIRMHHTQVSIVFISVFIFVFLTLTTSVHAQGYLFEESFESEPLGSAQENTYWGLSLDGGSVSIENATPLGTGGGSKYFVGQIVKTATGDAFRSERRPLIASQTRPSFSGSSLGYDMWYGVRIRLDRVDGGVSGYPIQWHDDPGGDNVNPTLALTYDGTNVGLILSRTYTSSGSIGSDYEQTIGSFPEGSVIDVVFRVDWDTRPNALGGSGEVDVYINDETTPRVQYRGSTAHSAPYNSSGRIPFIKMGGYWSLLRFPSMGTPGDVVKMSYDQLRVQGAGGSRLGVKPQGTRGTTPPPTTPSTCTNQQTSTATIPTGYGASYNPLTSAREYLVSVACGSGTTGTVTAGNGNPLTYVYNRGYYWTRKYLDSVHPHLCKWCTHLWCLVSRTSYCFHTPSTKPHERYRLHLSVHKHHLEVWLS